MWETSELRETWGLGLLFSNVAHVASGNWHKAEGTQRSLARIPCFLLLEKIILKRRTLFTYLLIHLFIFISGTQRNIMCWRKSYLVNNDAFIVKYSKKFFLLFVCFLDLAFRKIKQKKRNYGLLGTDLDTEAGRKGPL